MVHGVDRDLHIVADDARTTPTRCHRAAVGISERDLAVGRGQHLLLVDCELAHFFFQLVELLLEPRRLEHEHVGRFLSIRRIELGEIPRHTLLELRAPAIDLPSCKIAISMTALNLLPSIATLAFASRPIWRQRLTKLAHTLRIAGPLSLRKSAITLSSGTSRPSSHMTSKFRPASRSSRRLDCTRLR